MADFEVLLANKQHHVTASLQVAYCRTYEEGGFKVGMEFVGTQSVVMDVIGKFTHDAIKNMEI